MAGKGFYVGFQVKTDQRKWNDVINKIATTEMDLRKQMASDVEKAAIELTQIARQNAHVITGNMRNSINYHKASAESLKVTADIFYAVYENARGGDHAFFDNALDEFKPRYITVMTKGVSAVIAKKKTAV